MAEQKSVETGRWWVVREKGTTWCLRSKNTFTVHALVLNVPFLCFLCLLRFLTAGKTSPRMQRGTASSYDWCHEDLEHCWCISYTCAEFTIRLMSCSLVIRCTASVKYCEMVAVIAVLCYIGYSEALKCVNDIFFHYDGMKHRRCQEIKWWENPYLCSLTPPQC